MLLLLSQSGSPQDARSVTLVPHSGGTHGLGTAMPSRSPAQTYEKAFALQSSAAEAAAAIWQVQLGASPAVTGQRLELSTSD